METKKEMDDMEKDLGIVDMKRGNVSGTFSITPADLTKKQNMSLQEFKNRLVDIPGSADDEFYLLKWLKARNFDVDKTENMFRRSRSFKQEIGADKILEEYTPPEVLQKYMPGGFCGFDKEGSPIRVVLFGSLDMKGLMYSTKRSDLEKKHILDCETIYKQLNEQTILLGKRIDQITVIYDMEGTKMTALWKPGLQMYMHLVSMLEDNYPETVKRMFLINTPSYVNLFWSVLKAVISEDMKKKINMCGRDYKDVLLKYIDADQLPVYLGGTKTGPAGDVRCSDLICQGGEVPKEFYFKESSYLENMDCDLIQAGHKKYIFKTVDQPGAVLKWEFRTEDHDIGFRITYKATEDDTEKEIIPLKRLKSHQIMQDGQVTCDKTGQYNVILSNKHSCWRSKLVYHKIQLK